jgi:hypothetical protein
VNKKLLLGLIVGFVSGGAFMHYRMANRTIDTQAKYTGTF